jgi:hypothetical protein
MSGSPTLPQLIEIGADYRGEIVLEKKGAIKLLTLEKDAATIKEVDAQKLDAHVKLDGTTEPIPVPFEPAPVAGDSPGKTSQFVGKIPQALWGKPLVMVLPITIDKKRFRANFPLPRGGHDEDVMPVKVADEEERKLYLTPGGKYTLEDIKANGKVTASQKYDVSGWGHDLRPKAGDKICPITLTKANPNCTWIIGGKTYEFCCPPCIDAFVQLAKEQPQDIKDPESYRKK